MKVGAADGRGAFFALRTAFILSKLDTYRIKYFDEVLMTLGELLRHDNASNRILVDGSALVTYTARGAGTCDACGCPYAIGDAIIGRHVRLDDGDLDLEVDAILCPGCAARHIGR
jgi:hypothetical protein